MGTTDQEATLRPKKRLARQQTILRRYSIHEIEDMRNTLWRIRYLKTQDLRLLKNGGDLEDELRTHMANGTDPNELTEHEAKLRLEKDRASEWHDAAWKANQRFCQHDFQVKGAYCNTCGLRDRRDDSGSVEFVPVKPPTLQVKKRRFWRGWSSRYV